MLKHLLTAFGITLVLTGCQTQQEKLYRHQLSSYNAHCMTYVPRNQCINGASSHDSALNGLRACEIEQSIIRSCANFVTTEVNYMFARGDQPQAATPPAPIPSFSPVKTAPIIIDVDVKDDWSERFMAGDEIEWSILVNPVYPPEYLQAAEKAEQLATYMLESYEKTVRFHLRQPESPPQVIRAQADSSTRVAEGSVARGCRRG